MHDHETTNVEAAAHFEREQAENIELPDPWEAHTPRERRHGYAIAQPLSTAVHVDLPF